MKHEQRIADNLEFKFLKEDIAEYVQRQNEKTLSLNEQTRRKEREVREAKLKAREVMRAKLKAKGGAELEEVRQDDGLQANERSLKDELAAEKARKLATDFVLEEAAHILSDGIGLMQSSTRLAQQAISKAARPKQDAGAVTR